MLERTDAITNEVLEPITFVLAYPTVYTNKVHKPAEGDATRCTGLASRQIDRETGR